ncbi:hypothetical protein L1049_012838 [Liquidambar formosana]|uniref:Uncharacterized protein n=1 Tax=Liquidambar formosana TaxID=63359 RepID=A0AAP0WWH9_LIQFO
MEPSAAKYEEGSSWSTHQPTSSPPEWVVDIRNHLKEKHLHINNAGERCSLSRVPPSMRQIDEDNYIPELVSIGPFHRDNPSLQSMEAHKLRFLYGILDPMTYKTNTVDSSSKNWRVKNVTLDGLERAMKELEKKTRECYSEKFDAFTSDEFVRMMVLDSCFIVELLRLYAMINQEGKSYKTILQVWFKFHFGSLKFKFQVSSIFFDQKNSINGKVEMTKYAPDMSVMSFEHLAHSRIAYPSTRLPLDPSHTLENGDDDGEEEEDDEDGEEEGDYCEDDEDDENEEEEEEEEKGT